MLGVLLINKAEGWTSHDVVAKLRGILRTKKIGHAGTLDPLATGLLVVAVGSATRFLQFMHLEPKIYETTFRFGVSTNTYDAEGEVTEERPVPADLEAKLVEILPDFVGEIKQLPPMYSAVKKAGKPLYAYARKGEEVERELRDVFIEEIEILEIKGSDVRFRMTCSGGTYVRTLAHDIGERLGCGSYVESLSRTQIGSFRLDAAKTIEEIGPADLIPLSVAVHPMPVASLNETQVEHVHHGRPIRLSSPIGATIALANPAGDIIGIGIQQGPMYQPECVIPVEAYGSRLLS